MVDLTDQSSSLIYAGTLANPTAVALTVLRDPPACRTSGRRPCSRSPASRAASRRATAAGRSRSTGCGARAGGRAAAGPAVEWDRFAGRARLADTAQRPSTRAARAQEFVAAYVDGVRAGFAEGATAPEFAGTMGPGVAAWTPLGVFLVHHALFSFPTRLWRPRAVARPRPSARRGCSARDRRGTNAWALHGSRTTSGLPLLGGDPHRMIELPGVYQQVRLACDEFDVVGLAFPGVPGVQHFGHTGTSRGGSPTRWPTTRTSARRRRAPGRQDADDRVLGDVGLSAVLPLLRARTVADVDAALDHWVEPVNNVLVADTTGRVLHRVAGRVPVRDGSSGAWTGWAAPAAGSRSLPTAKRGHRPTTAPTRAGTSLARPLRPDVAPRPDRRAARWRPAPVDVGPERRRVPDRRPRRRPRGAAASPCSSA